MAGNQLIKRYDRSSGAGAQGGGCEGGTSGGRGCQVDGVWREILRNQRCSCQGQVRDQLVPATGSLSSLRSDHQIQRWVQTRYNHCLAVHFQRTQYVTTCRLILLLLCYNQTLKTISLCTVLPRIIPGGECYSDYVTCSLKVKE